MARTDYFREGVRARGGGARAQRGVQMCRRFCKVTVDTRKGTRKCLRVHGCLNGRGNSAADGGEAPLK